MNMSMSVNEFDKRILKDNRYRDALIQKLGESEKINLSEAITNLIGFTNSKPNNLSKDFLHGFFYLDTHCIEDAKPPEGWITLRNNAISKLKLLLKQNEISLAIDSYIDSDITKRDIFRNGKMSICAHNIQQLFKNRKIICKGKKFQSCGKEWKIKVQNMTDKDDAGFLYMPSVCIKEKLCLILQSIVQHSICSHNGTRKTDIFDIELQGTNIGNESKCIYAVIIKVFSNNNPPWKTVNGKLVCPTTTVYDASGLLPFCDYLILAPNNDKYHMINFAAKYNNEIYDFLPIDDRSIFIRFRSSKFMFKQTNDKIYFNNDTVNEEKLLLYVGIGTKNNGQKPIIHIMVFNNYQKVSK